MVAFTFPEPLTNCAPSAMTNPEVEVLVKSPETVMDCPEPIVSDLLLATDRSVTCAFVSSWQSALIKTSAPEPGTNPELQLEAVLQLPAMLKR